MKYLLVIVVLFLVLWLWRAGRGGPQTPPSRHSGASQPPPKLEMVRCCVCGVHLPEADAVRADSAYYCSVEHLNQAIGR